MARPRQTEAQQVAIPLDGAAQAHIHLGFGAGDLLIRGGASPGEALAGNFSGGVEHAASRDGAALRITVQSLHEVWRSFPWQWGNAAREWQVALNGQIPLTLDVEAGASNSQIDLTELKVSQLRLQVGASHADVTLPAGAGHTQATVEAGAASVQIRIPAGVAARIQFQGGAASFEADSTRFPRTGSYRQSPDYESAANKIDLQVDAGAGSITVS